MKITNKDINRDISFVLGEIKSAEVEIPSFWRCIWPSLVFIPLFLVWQISIFIGYKIDYDPSGTWGFSIFISFMFMLVSTHLRGKYLSLPTSVRERSIIINIFKKKTRFYVLLWLLPNMAFGMMMRHFDFTPDFTMPFFLFGSLIALWFIAIADLSRYDLSLLNTAVQRWREGGGVIVKCGV